MSRFNEDNTELVDINSMRTQHGKLKFSKMQATGDAVSYTHLVAIASAIRALSPPGRFPFSSSIPALPAVPTSVPTVSNISTIKKLSLINILWRKGDGCDGALRK